MGVNRPIGTPLEDGRSQSYYILQETWRSGRDPMAGSSWDWNSLLTGRHESRDCIKRSQLQDVLFGALLLKQGQRVEGADSVGRVRITEEVGVYV